MNKNSIKSIISKRPLPLEKDFITAIVIIAENVGDVLVRVGIRDIFPESGSGEELFDKFKMNSKDIVEIAKKLIKIKRYF